MSPHCVWNVEGAGEGSLEHTAGACRHATAGTQGGTLFVP